MPLGDADVKKACGEIGSKRVEPRAVLHGSRDGADRLVAGRHPAELLPEDIGKRRRGRDGRHPGIGVEAADAVEILRRLFCGLVALALPGDQVDQDRLAQRSRRAQKCLDFGNIVAVDRPEIGKAQVFKQRRTEQAPAHPFFDLVRQRIELLAEAALRGQRPVAELEVEIPRPQPRLGKVTGDRADVRRDRHAVVIEQHDHRLAAGPGVVEALVGQPAGQRAVAHQGQHMIVFALERPCAGHAERDGDRVRRMPGDKRVMHALARLREAGKPALLAERIEPVHAAGQHLMDVALVADVEQPVTAGIEYAVDGDRRLHDAEVGGQMAAGPADVLHQKLPDLLTQGRQLLLRHGEQIFS